MGFSELLSAADRFSMQLLGTSLIRYAPSLQGEYADVFGIFETNQQRVDVLGAPVGTASPAVFIRLEDILPHDPETDEHPVVNIGAKNYRVRETQKDGQGGAMLYLQEMS